MDTLSSGHGGGLAQVVERSIRIREAPGSIPGFSRQFWFYLPIRQHYVVYWQWELTDVKQHSIWIRKDPESIDIQIMYFHSNLIKCYSFVVNNLNSLYFQC